MRERQKGGIDERDLEKGERERGRIEKKGNKSLTSSAHCDTLTLLSFVNQQKCDAGYTFNGMGLANLQENQGKTKTTACCSVQSIYSLNDFNSTKGNMTLSFTTLPCPNLAPSDLPLHSIQILYDTILCKK